MQQHNCDNKIIWKTLLVNILFWVLCVLFFTIRFETVDDLRMAELVHGVFSGVYDNQLIFMNQAIAKVFNILLEIAPNVEWYAILWVFLVAVSLFIISFIFIRNNNKYGIILTMALMLFFGLDFAISLQFTKIASIVTVAGMLLIIDVESNKAKFIYLIGVTMMLLGCLIRRDAFFLALIPFAFYYLFLIFKKRKELFHVDTIILFVKPFIAVVLCVLIAKLLPVAFANDYDNQWHIYYKFNSYRAELSDLGFPEYEANKELYDSLGITEEDIMYWTQTRNFADPEIFNVDSAERLVEAKKASDEYRNKDFFNRFLKKILLPFFSYEWIYLIVIITLLYYLFIRRELFFLLIEYAGIILCQLYFSYLGRYHLERVDKSLFFSLFCIVVWMILRNCESLRTIDLLNSRMISMWLVMFVLGIQLYTANYVASSEEVTTMVDAVSNDKDNLYLVTLQTEIEWNANLSAFYSKELGSMSNILPIGGWMSNLPVLENVKENYSVENPFRDAVNNEHVYLIDVGDGSGILSYIQRHYYEDAYLELCSSIGNLNCFRVKCDE